MSAATRPHDDDQRHLITVCAMRCLPPLITLLPHPHDRDHDKLTLPDPVCSRSERYLPPGRLWLNILCELWCFIGDSLGAAPRE